MKSDIIGSGESKLETAISYLLIIGVIFSLILEAIGLTLFYYSFANLNILENEVVFIREENFFSFVITTLQGENIQNSAILFMTLGLITLISTPYIRVITSVIYFAWEKNRKYLLLTLFVLIILTVSLTLH
jgi:uncharacterized membrane protein